MPDEETAEVQETVADEASAFASDDDLEIEDGTEGLTADDLPDDADDKDDDATDDKGEKADDEQDADEKTDDDADDKDGETDDKGDEDEEAADPDEDLNRGKEIIDAEKKAEEDRLAEEAARKAQQEEAGSYNPMTETLDSEKAEFFRNVLPGGLFPDTVKLNDGTELNFGAVMQNEPELPVMMAVVANNIIRQLIHSKYLPTSDDIQNLNKGVDNKLFMRTLTNPRHGVPDAVEIYKSPKFKEWFKGQPEEIKALPKSNDPKDHIRLYKRYLAENGVNKAKADVEERDGKRKAAKKDFDAVHKTTVRSKRGRPKSVVNPREEEKAGFNEKDDDDDFYA